MIMIHLPIHGFMAGTIDIDKRMPHISKIFSDSKISKKTEPIECIKVSQIKKNLKLTKLFEKKTDIDINIDLYATSPFCHTYFDIYFEADLELFELLVKGKGIMWNLLFHGQVNLSEKNSNFTTIITQICLPYYNLEKLRKIENSLDSIPDNISKNLDIIFEKTGVNFYCIEAPITNMLSLGPMGSSILIEDYHNYIDINNEPWESITNSENQLYYDESKGYFICKNKNIYNETFEHFFYQKTYYSKLAFIRQSPCIGFLNAIKRKGINIRKNIAESHQNPYYWKELKKEIEILDLNFLELHTDAVKSTIIDYDSLDKNKKYQNQINEKNNIQMAQTLKLLNEIKYAISNLSTPSHIHDEAMLHAETEKVNDRILMFTFVAMAVSAIGMMQSTEIALEFKVLSGAGIFSLPALYYLFRGIQKKVSFRKNKISEIQRTLKAKTENFQKKKAYLDALINEKDDNFPDGFKEEIIKFINIDLSADEKAIGRLKEKI